MELSSPRFKALTVSTGFSFWFFIITSVVGIFSIEIFIIFILVVFPLLQILSKKVSNILDIFAIYNTKFFLGVLFITVISVYGLLFKILRIDLLRLNSKEHSYWLKTDQFSSSRFFKQY